MLTARSLAVTCAREFARSRPVGATSVVVRAFTDPTKNLRSAAEAASAASEAPIDSVAHQGKEEKHGLQRVGDEKSKGGGSREEGATLPRAFDVSQCLRV